MIIKNKKIVFSPIKGKVKDITFLKDGVFSEKMLGDGVVVIPDSKEDMIKFYSPVSGKLINVFETGHAFGIATKKGAEILLHIGIDTVELKGKGFKIANVKQGDKIEAGTLLVTVDPKELARNSKSSEAIIVVANKYPIKSKNFKDVTVGEEIFKLK